MDAASGTLKLSGLVTGTGQMRIEAGDTLEIATGAVAATNTVDFNGLGATLKIDNNAAVAKPIVGLGGGSRIDLGAATSATAVISGTTLRARGLNNRDRKERLGVVARTQRTRSGI